MSLVLELNEETTCASPTPLTIGDAANCHEPPMAESKVTLDAQRPKPSSTIQVGLQRKASPLLLDSWTALSLTLEGRDKITKFVQYLARLLTYYYSSRAKGMSGTSMAGMAAPWQALYTNLSFSRKAFRLGRSAVELEKLRNLGLWAALIWDRQCEKKGSGKNGARDVSTPIWKLLGTALKTLGLCGFWAADNLNFLVSIGCLDDYNKKHHHGGSGNDNFILQQRKVGQQKWAIRANQSYFFGALAGLFVNLKTFLQFQQGEVVAAYQMWNDATTAEELDTAKQSIDRMKEKQFLIILDLIKSCCDALVFSNNPGVDLWAKYRGLKLHEGYHCIGGMMSAAVVLYNNYPNITMK